MTYKCYFYDYVFCDSFPTFVLFGWVGIFFQTKNVPCNHQIRNVFCYYNFETQ